MHCNADQKRDCEKCSIYQNKQQKRQEKENFISQLERVYKHYNSFEIFKPITPEFPSYQYNRQMEIYKAFIIQFGVNEDSCTIRFNKSDIDIIEIDNIINACQYIDIRIQKYITEV
jgi:hypothetical protein